MRIRPVGISLKKLGGAALPGPLPSYIDPDKVSASYKDGVLVLGLPKREDAKPRRIEIT